VKREKVKREGGRCAREDGISRPPVEVAKIVISSISRVFCIDESRNKNSCSGSCWDFGIGR
jgi:hypothetical protein